MSPCLVSCQEKALKLSDTRDCLTFEVTGGPRYSRGLKVRPQSFFQGGQKDTIWLKEPPLALPGPVDAHRGVTFQKCSSNNKGQPYSLFCTYL